MTFLSLEPFVPSGRNFESAKQLFQELGFTVGWDAGDYVGFQKDGCKFIMQKFDKKDFAENFMISVSITDADAFWQEVEQKQLSRKYGVRVTKPVDMPYGREVNLIDIAGVCWHFVQQ